MRKSWMYMGVTAMLLGVAMVVAWILAVIAVPVLLVGGLGAILLGLILPSNKGYYFTYDSEHGKLVKKKVQ